MAISKNQPMRPAEIDLVDAVNDIEDFISGDLYDAITALQNAVSDIQNVIGSGFSSENTISDVIGSGFSSESTIADALDDTNEKIGGSFTSVNTVADAINGNSDDITTINGLIGDGFTARSNITDFLDLMTQWETLNVSDVVTLVDTTNFSLHNGSMVRKLGKIISLNIGLTVVNSISTSTLFSDVLTLATNYRPKETYNFTIASIQENISKWYFDNGSLMLRVNTTHNANTSIWLRGFYPID